MRNSGRILILLAFLATFVFGSVPVNAGAGPAPAVNASIDSGKLATPPGGLDARIIEKYRQKIPELMAEQGVPGLALAVVDDQGILWSDGFGYTDRDRKTAVTPDTMFSIQSTSKTVTATAVMLAVQDGLVALDEPITTYLPDFTVHSIFEEHPERKITLRSLLGHTAGLTHEAPVGNNYDLGTPTFEEHIRSISDTWLRIPVGSGYTYSNLGLDLAAYILQKVSGKPFAQYVSEKLLQPLGMANSSFDMAAIATNPHRAVGHSNPLPSVPVYIPIPGSGGFYASANDMARFIQFHINLGAVDGRQLLNPDLLNEMYTVPAPNEGSPEGYALGIARTRRNIYKYPVLYMHGGGGFGFLSDLFWLPELKLGISLLMNSTDNDLQGTLALQILDDVLSTPGSPYQDRLQRLDSKSPVSDGDGHFRPPAGLKDLIASHAMPASQQDAARWAGYTGQYKALNWNVMNPASPPSRVYSLSGNLYVDMQDVKAYGEYKLTEVAPGLFFADNGEALDFRGPVLTYANIRLYRVESGLMPWQVAVLGLCAAIFLATLLTLPVAPVLRRRAKSMLTAPENQPGRWGLAASILAALGSLFGILSIALLVIYPMLIYSGFLGWLDVPAWQRLIFHAPFALAVCVLGLVGLSLPLWRRRWWTLAARVHYTALSLAGLALVFLLLLWRLVGLNLG